MQPLARPLDAQGTFLHTGAHERRPAALLDTFILAYPSKRYRSTWMGIAVHSAQSVVIAVLVLTLVV